MVHYIAVKEFTNYKHGYKITSLQLKRLLEHEYIAPVLLSNEEYIHMEDLNVINSIHIDLNENYTRLSTFFLQFIGKSASYNDIDFYNKLVNGIDKNPRIYLYHYLGVNYIHNKDIEILQKEFVAFQDIIKTSNISPAVYEHFVKDYSIQEIIFGDTLRLIKESDWMNVKSNMTKYDFLDKIQFVSCNKIIESRMYNDIFNSRATLLNFCRHFEIHFYCNYRGIYYIDSKRFHYFVDEQRKTKMNSVDFINIRKIFLGISTQQRRIQDEILKSFKTMFDTYNFEYKQLLDSNGELNYYFNKDGVQYFLSEFVTFDYLKDYHNINRWQLNYLIKLLQLETYNIARNLTLIKNTNLKKLFNSDIAKIYLKKTNKFYTKNKFAKHLGVGMSKLNLLTKEEGLHTYKMLDTFFYNRHDLINLRGKMESIAKEYVPLNHNVSNHSLDFKNFKTRKKATGAERYAFGDAAFQQIVKRSEMNEYLRKKQEQEQHKIQIDTIDYNKPWEAFQDLLILYGYDQAKIIKNPSVDHWINFIFDRLNKTNFNSNSLRYVVNSFLNCTISLIEFIGNDELKNKSTNEINLVLLNTNKKHLELCELYLYLRSYFYSYPNEIFKFSFKKLNSPYDIDKKKRKTKTHSKEVFSYEEFDYIFSYTNDLIHLKPAIMDCLKALNDSSEYRFKNLCYTWLYVLVHLNNAWRHTDVCEMKMVNLGFLNIESLSDFQQRILSPKEINKIVSLLLSKDYAVSKTNVTTKLYITESIKESLAYSYTLCYLFNKEKHPFSDRIIHFNNKANTFNHSYNKAFFSNSEITINFQNRKMNRTLLSLMYKLVQKNNPKTSSIDIVKRLRSHRNMESTHTYIDVPEEDLNSLTVNLFDKGIFGYIPDAMIKIIEGKPLSIQQTKQPLNNIGKIFKDIYNIEVSSGFINHLITEKELLIDQFIKKDPIDVFNQLNNLKLNLLPGKDENFQCLAENNYCVYPGKDCSDCILSVPNFYAISNIVRKIISNIKYIKNEFGSLEQTEKVKYANLTLNLLETLHYAIERFGEEGILQFFEDEKEGYIKLLNSLDNIENNKSLLDYASYNLEVN